jgi:hypothetical protein
MNRCADCFYFKPGGTCHMVGHEVTPDDICNNFRAKYLPIFWIVVLRTDPDLIFEVEQAVCDSRDVGSYVLQHLCYCCSYCYLRRRQA